MFFHAMFTHAWTTINDVHSGIPEGKRINETDLSLAHTPTRKQPHDPLRTVYTYCMRDM